MLKTYRTYDSIVRFSKYESYNKLLDDVTLYIYIYIINFELKKKNVIVKEFFAMNVSH